MSIQEGVGRIFRIARYAKPLLRPGKTGFNFEVPRVSIDRQFAPDLVENNQKTKSRQRRSVATGIKRVSGTVNDLPTNFIWYPIWQQILRKYFSAANVAVASAARTFTVDGATNKIVASSGDFTTEFSVNDEIRLEGEWNVADNVGRPLTISAVAALSITVNETLVTDATATAKGKVVASGQTNPKQSSAAVGDGFSISSATRTITRAAGGGESFLTDGRLIGEVFALTGVWGTAGNLAKNFTITDVTATTIKVAESILDDAGPNTGAVITVAGASASHPITNHESYMFAIEGEETDLATPESIIQWDLRFNGASVQLNPAGEYTQSFPYLARDAKRYDAASTPSAGAPFFTGTVQPAFRDPFAAQDAYIVFGDTIPCEITSLGMNITNNLSTLDTFRCSAERGLASGPFFGKFVVSLSAQVALEDSTFWDYVDNKTEIPVTVVMESSSINPVTNAPEFKAYHFPRCRVVVADRDDPDSAVIQTVQLEVLERVDAVSPSAYDQTTMRLQDSTL